MFRMGRVGKTKDIAAAIEEDKNFAMEVAVAIERYKACDWGDINKEDGLMNDMAIKSGEGISASYKTSKGNILIITAWNRIATTILFPNEEQEVIAWHNSL